MLGFVRLHRLSVEDVECVLDCDKNLASKPWVTSLYHPWNLLLEILQNHHQRAVERRSLKGDPLGTNPHGLGYGAQAFFKHKSSVDKDITSLSESNGGRRG